MAVQFEKTGVINASGQTVNPNLLINTNFSQTYQQTTGWDTAKNGTTLASSWGGYNSGVANAGTVYHAHLKQFGGEWVYEYIRNADNSWLGVSQGNLHNYIDPDVTLTFSCDEYITSGSNNYLTGGPYFKTSSSGNASFAAGQFSFGGVDKDKWVRCVWTVTIPNSFYKSGGCSWYIYGMSGGNGTVYMRRPKLEISSTATPWCLAANEGYEETHHGIVEQQPGSPTRFYNEIIQSKEFIEI